MTKAAVSISEYPFLDEAMCRAVVTELEEHTELALDRSPTRPGTYITYGRAAYLDVCMSRAKPERDYYGALAVSNRGLQSILGGFLEKFRAKIELILDQPVIYEPDFLALPGVHIFRREGIRRAGEAGVHFDLQYQKLALPRPPDEDVKPISVTLPLRNPLHGTGLQVHNVSYEDYERAYKMGRITSLDQLVQRRTSAYYPYSIGTLFLHRGLVLHCLATPGPMAPSG